MARVRLDAVSAAAVETARSAALEVADAGGVGEHLRVRADGERLVTHLFECQAAGYRGWQWEVTLARAPRAKVATVCEVDLVAGSGAVVSPEWLPWSNRLQPGDLNPGDQLPRIEDDERLEQGYEATDDQEADQLAEWELGLGRPRVLSPEGRRQAGNRWETGEFGPQSAMARQAGRTCRVCGFLVPLAGVLRQGFGICANEWSPGDGHVVSLDYGCGAHSETDEVRSVDPVPDPVVDDQVVDLVARPTHREPTLDLIDTPAVEAEPAPTRQGSESDVPEASS